MLMTPAAPPEPSPTGNARKASPAGRMLVMAAAALMLTGLVACDRREAAPSAPPTQIRFSVMAVESGLDEKENWGPFFADMESQTGLKVRPLYQSDGVSPAEAMRFGQVDVGWFSNLAGLAAVRRAGGEVFARTTDVSGVDGDHAVIIAPAASDLTLERLVACDRSLNFGMGDAQSASARLAPALYLFLPRGIDPEKCFKTVRQAGHRANLVAVANGVLDAATNNSTAMEMIARDEPALAGRVKEIWRSPPLPEDPIVWRKDLHPSAKEKIRSFLLTYGAAEGSEGERQRQVLARLGFGGFRAADDAHLVPIRQMEATGRLLEARRSGNAEAVRTIERELSQIAGEGAAAGAPPLAPRP